MPTQDRQGSISTAAHQVPRQAGPMGVHGDPVLRDAQSLVGRDDDGGRSAAGSYAAARSMDPVGGPVGKIDLTETEIGAAWGAHTCSEEGQRLTDADILVVVSGPDQDDEIRVLSIDECFLSRETAEALAREILRRLGIELPRQDT